MSADTPPTFSYDEPSVFDEEPSFSYDGPSVFDEKPPRPRLRQWLTVAVVAALFAGSVGAAWWVRRVPVEQSPGGYFGVLEPLDRKDTTFSDAAIHLENPGGDLEILSVEPKVTSNVEVLGAYVIWPNEASKYGYYGSTEFPDDDHARATKHRVEETVPLSEFRKVADARDRFALVTIGLRIVSGKYGGLDGTLVTYRVNGKKSKVYFRNSILACVKPTKCTGKDERGDDISDGLREKIREEVGMRD